MKTKVCPKCKQEKPVGEFYVRKDTNNGNGISPYCKICTRSKTKRWKKQNPKKLNGQTRRRQNKVRGINRDWALHQLGGRCMDCGFQYDGTNSRLFDFHHLNPLEKEHRITGQFLMKSRDIIQNELDKCVLLCKPDHRKRHSDYKRGLRDTL